MKATLLSANERVAFRKTKRLPQGVKSLRLFRLIFAWRMSIGLEPMMHT